MITKAYYWTGKKNFGDLLTPLLLTYFSKLKVELAEPSQARVVVAGSILEHLPLWWDGYIVGSGKLHEGSKIDLPHSHILALRGPLTARGIKGSYVLGDPGLLADELVGDEDKEWDLGIVPHWTDTSLEKDSRFLKYNPKIIRVSDDPLQVISEIGRCKKIVSSSLHGVILADAFGIPRRIEVAPRLLTHAHQEGGLFKWRDYLASINMRLEVGLTQLADRNVIIEKQHELFDVFEEVKAVFS